ncbi:uncharacterized protein [Rutidosis leptorrhynchoides]
MGQKRTMFDFFKPTNVDNHQSQQEVNNIMEDIASNPQSRLNDDNIMEESPRVEIEKNNTSKLGDFNLDSLVRDPGLRPSFMDYPINQHGEIRRAYIKHGPYQLHKSKYVQSSFGSNSGNRSFQQAWFSKFWWLEYSEVTDAAYCFPCYLFYKKPIGRAGSDTFIKQGFRNWKKVNCGQDCSFIKHEGKTPASAHNYSVKCYEDLKNQLGSIENVIEKQSTQEIIDNRLRVRTSVEIIKWLTMQACALRGHDERPDSKNRGNFLELMKLIASYNKEVDKVVLENAPKNATYTSPDVQKEILQIFATNVQQKIRDEIGNAKFCLIVDECRDESKKEQMAIVVRFVDQDGYIKERFLDLVHVKDTSALTLKNEILASFSFHKLDVQDIRGQGYDGASNMRGEWKGLQALILKECPYAYYIHCFAHQLQLALVSASKEVVEVHKFFKNMNFIINVLDSSSKRHDQLQDAQISELAHLAEIGELESGKGANQIKSLQRPGDTRWSSHYRSICSLLKLYGPAIVVLREIATNGSTPSQKGDASFALTELLSFDFVFIMHLMKKIMKRTDKLCQAFQRKSQDIVNALSLISTTKMLIQKLRDQSWQSLLNKVVGFCESNSIRVPKMTKTYKDIVRSRSKKDDVTVEHHYRVDVFIAAVDSQLQELNSRFSESVTELLQLSVALDPRKSFNKNDICKLAKTFYPLDFTEQEIIQLKHELQHYELDVPNHPELKKVQTIAELCRGLQETNRSEVYPLLDRLIRLILTLPVSTATSERAFSSMKIVKTRLRSSMSDDFLKHCLILYIERDIAETFSIDEIIDDFSFKKPRRVRLQMPKVTQ